MHIKFECLGVCVCVEIKVPIEVRKLLRKVGIKRARSKAAHISQQLCYACCILISSQQYLLYVYLSLNNYTILAVYLCPHNNYGIPISSQLGKS